MTDQDEKLIKEWNSRNDFVKEKDFQRYLVDNLSLWVKDRFGSDVKKYVEQYYLSGSKVFGGNKPRVDLYLELENGKIIGIEIKNPSQRYAELSRSISQLLSYSVLAEWYGKPFNEIAIITSKFDPIIIGVIKRFNLPIRVFMVNKLINCEII